MLTRKEVEVVAFDLIPCICCRPKPDDPSNLTEENLCSFAADIARALQYLSEQNYVHRDVAARNVLGKQRVIINFVSCTVHYDVDG